MEDSNHIIFVLGMHRSGTSALAGCLELLGMNLGQDLMPAGPDNLKGFYEHRAIHNINEQLFQNLNTTWDTPFFEDNTWIHSQELEELRHEIRIILSQFQREGRPAVLKDPRFSVLLPVWEDVAKELGLQPKCIIMLRSPLEVAASLFKRNHFNFNKSFLLYTNYLLHAEKNSRKHDRVFIEYLDLLENPEAAIAQVMQELNFHIELTTEQIRTISRPFVEKKLRHFVHGDLENEIDHDNVFIENALEAYELIVKLNSDTESGLADLDDMILEFEYHFDSYYRGLITKKTHFASFHMSTDGDVYSQKSDQKITVFTKKLRFAIPAHANWIKFKLYPSNSPSYIVFDKIELISGQEVVVVPPEHIQASIEHGNQLLFKANEFIRFGKTKNHPLDFVDIYLNYQALGENVINHLGHLSESVNKWFYKQINSLRDDLKNDEQELKKLLKQLEVFQQQLSIYRTDLEKAQNSSIFQQTEIQEKEKLLNKANSQRDVLSRELSKANENIISLEQKLESSNADLTSLKKEMKTLQENLANSAKDIGKLNENNLKLEAGIKKKTKSLAQEKLKAAKLSEAINENENRIANLQMEVQRTEAAHLQTLNTIHNQHQEILQFKEDYGKREVDLQEIKSSISFRLGSILTAPFRWIYDLVYKDQAFTSSSFSFFLKILWYSMTHPIAVVKNINGKNLQTLRRAMNSESKALILKNLRHKLTGEFPELDETEEISEIDLSELELKINQKKDLADERLRVLYISPNLPDFDESSGGKRATRMLKLMAEEYDVYAYTSGSKPRKHVDKLNEVGVILLANLSKTEIKRRLRHFDVLIFAWYYSIFDEYRFVELFPEARVIIDSVDVHWVREERSIGIWDGVSEEIVLQNKQKEKEAYAMADIVWAVTENDRLAILTELPKADVRIVSNIHHPVTTKYRDPGNNTMLFIGGFNHYPNISAVQLIVEEILPRVKKEVPSAQLIIAGSKAPPEVQALGKIEGVIFKGFIPDAEMDKLYSYSFLAVCPLRAGAGIKGKICEAISYMTPVVTNAIGNEGINLVHLESGIITDDYELMAESIIQAMERKVDLDKLTKEAQKNLYHLVGESTVKNRMMNSIRPEISICIVTWNRMDLLKSCIESIEGNSRYPRYRILVHSNGCTDGTQAYLEAASQLNPKIVPILSKENEVFVIPNNRMMEMFPENDVVLLNNDTRVTENWLMALHESAYLSKDIGIVGSKILYPDGRLQEFGSELYEDGTGRNIGKWQDPNDDDYKRMMRAGYVSGCSMYIKRNTINQIGVFDEQFHPCYCEDSDYCYTAWENGIQTVVSPFSLVYHLEGGTSGTDTSKGFKKFQEVNFKKFLKKHGSKLKSIQKKIGKLNGQYVEEHA